MAKCVNKHKNKYEGKKETKETSIGEYKQTKNHFL
jgi:hypothetical protein